MGVQVPKKFAKGSEDFLRGLQKPLKVLGRVCFKGFKKVVGCYEMFLEFGGFALTFGV